MDSEILALIRLYINDSETTYTFTDEQIETIYTQQNNNLYLSIAELWLIKAGKAEQATTAFSLGNESYSFSDSKESCMENYKIYLNKANQATAQLFSGDASVETQSETKYSNLMGGAYSAESYSVKEDSSTESD